MYFITGSFPKLNQSLAFNQARHISCTARVHITSFKCGSFNLPIYYFFFFRKLIPLYSIATHINKLT